MCPHKPPTSTQALEVMIMQEASVICCVNYIIKYNELNRTSLMAVHHSSRAQKLAGKRPYFKCKGCEAI